LTLQVPPFCTLWPWLLEGQNHSPSPIFTQARPAFEGCCFRRGAGGRLQWRVGHWCDEDNTETDAQAEEVRRIKQLKSSTSKASSKKGKKSSRPSKKPKLDDSDIAAIAGVDSSDSEPEATKFKKTSKGRAVNKPHKLKTALEQALAKSQQEQWDSVRPIADVTVVHRRTKSIRRSSRSFIMAIWATKESTTTALTTWKTASDSNMLEGGGW